MDEQEFKRQRYYEIASYIRGCTSQATKIEYCSLAEELFSLTSQESFLSLRNQMKENNKKFNKKGGSKNV